MELGFLWILRKVLEVCFNIIMDLLFQSLAITTGYLRGTYKCYKLGGARGVMVIVVGNGHNDTSSNLGRD